MRFVLLLLPVLPWSVEARKRIRGGCQVQVDFFEFPYHVSLGALDAAGRPSIIFCGGTLISLRFFFQSYFFTVLKKLFFWGSIVWF